tara:strand:- start:243 stop:857 length:615 start_codon:yes stop_codon:yes gene_type:complete
MESQQIIYGKMVKKYKIPLDQIEDLNNRYDKAKETLDKMGHKLAGRIDSELSILPIVQSALIFPTFVESIQDYFKTCMDTKIIDWLPNREQVEIIACWINDMKEGEFNPPHTHYNTIGWSTVLFLKVPEIIDDTKDPHKFVDGKLGFFGVDGVSCKWEKPVVGDFYIFQANHMHCVMPFKLKNKNDVRRSMSFNFIEKREKEDA